MAAKSKPSPPPAEKISLYEKIVTLFPEVERKGDNVPYTSHNGNMFSYLHNSGTMALRLPEKEREDFLKQHKTKLMEAYGVVQKEYVTVPDKLLADAKAMKKYFAISLEYVKSLKPKPTTKKNSGKKK
ncbi:MAG: hypothetical protein ACHQD9_01685 [Chitinophagales bacterium]